jgi:hypothetical protein
MSALAPKADIADSGWNDRLCAKSVRRAERIEQAMWQNAARLPQEVDYAVTANMDQ